MSQSPPFKPGIGYVADSRIDLLRKLVWNTWYIATNGGGGGGGTTLYKGTVNLVAGQQSYAITFGAGFGAAPTFLTGSIQMVNDSGEVFAVAFDLSSLTSTGVTAWLSGVPTSASTGGKLNWGAAA